MMVIPMKWMPWLLLGCGAYVAFGEGQVGTGLIMAAIGGAWLYFKHAKA